jgi:4-amino-4-deoxy-L-arabinose transferase-like glycosyltransferase
MGNVWDEYFYYDASRSYLHAIVERRIDPDAWRSNFEHPPLGKYVYFPGIAWNQLTQPDAEDSYAGPRAVSALLGSITVVVIYLMGRRFWNERIGIAAAAITAVLPPMVAYSKIIDLDVSMVLWFTLAGYWLLAWLDDHRDRSLWWSTVFAGLAIASKFNAALFGLVVLTALVADRIQASRANRSWRVPRPIWWSPLVVSGILFVSWPWLWSDPIGQFQATLSHWSGTVRELYFGAYRTPGTEYFVLHFLVGTPLIVLILATLGIVQSRRSWTDRHWVVLTWLVAPFAISFYHLRQDHLRYVLTAFPALAIFAAIGLWQLTDWLTGRWQAARWIAPVLVAGSLAWTIVRAHPYYLNYYNPFVGGTHGVVAHERFELGFYGEGIKEATEFVNRTAPAGATVHYEVIPDDAPYLDRPRLVRQDTPPGATYLITNTNALHDPTKRDNFSLEGYHEVYAVRAAGAPFVWVYQKN